MPFFSLFMVVYCTHFGCIAVLGGSFSALFLAGQPSASSLASSGRPRTVGWRIAVRHRSSVRWHLREQEVENHLPNAERNGCEGLARCQQSREVARFAQQRTMHGIHRRRWITSRRRWIKLPTFDQIVHGPVHLLGIVSRRRRVS